MNANIHSGIAPQTESYSFERLKRAVDKYLRIEARIKEQQKQNASSDSSVNRAKTQLNSATKGK